MICYVLAFLAILNFCTDQRTFLDTTPMSVRQKASVCFSMSLIFLVILKFCTDQRLLLGTTLMRVRRKDLVVITLSYVFVFFAILKFCTNEGLFWGTTPNSDECQMQSFSSFYIFAMFLDVMFFSLSLCNIVII